MSANLDLVRSICASWERGDFSGSTDWVHPEIEYVIADGPSPGHWTGMAGLWKGFRDFLSTWEDLRVEVDEYRELDDERVRWSILVDYAHTTVCEKIVSQIDATCEAVIAQ